MHAPVARRAARLLVAALLTSVLVASAAGATAAPGAAARNAATQGTVRHDITFIAMLVPHHRSAVDMASVARERATTAPVRRLAAHTAEEQRRQIREMRAWLEDHDAEPMPPPAPVREMERQGLQMLRAAMGVEVDRMFLMMMRPHHAQALSEAEDELEHGRNHFALGVARPTRVDQARELALMNDLLAALG
jgi:uncharacterized protein (DUF305 family)